MSAAIETTMTSMALDSRRGVTDRLRSLPIDAVTVPVARASADLVSSAAQGLMSGELQTLPSASRTGFQVAHLRVSGQSHSPDHGPPKTLTLG